MCPDKAYVGLPVLEAAHQKCIVTHKACIVLLESGRVSKEKGKKTTSRSRTAGAFGVGTLPKLLRALIFQEPFVFLQGDLLQAAN